MHFLLFVVHYWCLNNVDLLAVGEMATFSEHVSDCANHAYLETRLGGPCF